MDCLATGILFEVLVYLGLQTLQLSIMEVGDKIGHLITWDAEGKIM